MYTNKTTTDAQLRDLLSNVKGFAGVLTRDELSKRVREKEFGIINMQKPIREGTHWVAYANSQSSQKYIYYFDSFGLPPPDDIVKFLKTSGKQVLYQDAQIQNIESTACGYYCVEFIKAIANKVSFYDFVYQFKQSPEFVNEKIINMNNLY